ncbi:hypothetical protein C1924_01375 [Stenotrophomonas sp. ESTM1D_MKCIP4_1]|nr:hypothetical protein C1924_01375 [Stenotrophomonas sp. ESTM1D_MKCIP4_1]
MSLGRVMGPGFSLPTAPARTTCRGQHDDASASAGRAAGSAAADDGQQFDFLQAGSAETPLPPGQCLTYGEGGTTAPALQSGKHYQVEMWGRTPGTPGHKGEAQSRWFTLRFCRMDVAGRAVIRTDKADCAPTMQPGD